MQRFTISLDDELAHQFDTLIAAKGYENRSEAVRDLIRSRLGGAEGQTTSTGPKPKWCVANVSYVYDQHDQTVTTRVLGLQHQHHDLVMSSVRTHLDHHHCIEATVLRGPAKEVRAIADQLIALRGVRHGQVHLILLDSDHKPHRHAHGGSAHTHLTPVN
ncbi:nickel-responsive transcriptional regulator NikR [Variovorax sp. Sphag1AA]|uniref:nickel-responsive transcriptional regulator NikR n=1 Tax=Variovorax sp. Sphag1AA TaxID=2587027 RepID=UPI00160F2C28|nr:nickel-responsive transcriptional regulator NikR [Variovorax sp. Sphag1AA]MBB3182057.1 CopG family nickel-responsive transcriptional regulator [Variovorax sp. Sphag1AA]